MVFFEKLPLVGGLLALGIVVPDGGREKFDVVLGCEGIMGDGIAAVDEVDFSAGAI